MSRTATIDRRPPGRVPTAMGRLARLLLISALALGCGPKNKNGSTTPKGKDGDTAGMKDQGPNGDGKGGGPPGGDQGGGDQGGGGQGGGDQGGGDQGGGDQGDDATASGPKIEPPVLDLSESERKARVQGSLARARAALESRARDPNLAIQEAKAALSVDPNSVDAVVLLAHAYYFRKLYDTAGVLLERELGSGVEVVKQRAQKHADLYYVYGLVFDKTGEPARATLAFETAVKLEPDHKNALANLAVHYLHDSRYAEARDISVRLTGPLGMRTAAAFTNLGSALRGLSASETGGNRNQLLGDAEGAYKRAIDIDKNYAIAYYDLALLYMDAKPFPLGTGDMDELVRLDRAKTYFKEYRALPGADITLVDDRLEQIEKAVKKETKARKKEEEAKKKKGKGGDDW
jgi:tetratricopeptide (TPR) repeat protein